MLWVDWSQGSGAHGGLTVLWVDWSQVSGAHGGLSCDRRQMLLGANVEDVRPEKKVRVRP